MICVLLDCKKHQIYNLKSVHKTPNNNTLKISSHLRLLIRVQIEQNSPCHSRQSALGFKAPTAVFVEPISRVECFLTLHLGIPLLHFWTMSASGFMGYLHYRSSSIEVKYHSQVFYVTLFFYVFTQLETTRWNLDQVQ